MIALRCAGFNNVNLEACKRNGIATLKKIKKSMPETKVMKMKMTMHTREQYIRQALLEGASGYLLKESTQEELVDAIERYIKVVWLCLLLYPDSS